ncbi:hypothetical protein [Sphingomonas japonica]|uniref:DNA-binding XRE family transcriptional regulator n=1 Tax=Sphingomonas japonica TaxID=511662 RepID=A0ABX0U2U3_9SPHN|nr:hypothetical protein [Sphingomonas japonica]NIJ24808.1 DNA-binding XRE family transcriptional regulator [Sphingomonas japonica]
MTLKDYLAQQSETIEAFAARVEASSGMIHKIVYGSRQPSLELASRIAVETGGKVQPLDMLIARPAARPSGEKAAA